MSATRPRFSARILLAFAAALLAIGIQHSTAHQPGISTLLVQLTTNHIRAQVIVAWRELEDSVPLDSNADQALSAAEFESAQPKLTRLAEGALSLEAGGRMLSLKRPPEVQTDDTTGLRFTLHYEFPTAEVVTVTSDIIAELQRGHNQVVTVQNAAGAELGTALLNRDRTSVDIPVAALANAITNATAPTVTNSPALQPRHATVRQFLWLGVEHIVTGWDHLAFLFGLLAVGGKLRDAVKIITSFTVAHSLTLVLATLNVIRIPSEIVEPIIAASVIYVGAENVVRKDFSQRWLLTFGFGLIHGCGFASILREMGIGQDGTNPVLPLACFNLGVELGQVAIAAVALPIIWALREKLARRWTVASSVALIAVGSYFLVGQLWE
jgi:hydrogenase/urease accessory protein HupE